jgi:hypothetical protein
MFKNMPKYILILSLVGIISACSANQFYHDSLMGGQVVSADGSNVVVCIGSGAGIEPGLIMAVSQVNYVGSITEGNDNYSLEPVGSIRIDTIIDKHFARATVVNGKVEKYNTVQLEDN